MMQMAQITILARGNCFCDGKKSELLQKTANRVVVGAPIVNASNQNNRLICTKRLAQGLPYAISFNQYHAGYIFIPGH